MHALIWISLGLIAGWLAHGGANAAARAGARDSGAPADPPLERGMRRLSDVERRIARKVLRRQSVARDPNAAFDADLRFGQRLADRVAAFGGSWTFISLFAAVLLAWMIYNGEGRQPFDPYPFILLNLVLSCLAAVQAPVILMSQNRQAAKDRSDARHDYEVNLKAELEIVALHEKLDTLRERDWLRLLELQERQIALLEQIQPASR